jgi:hypothetical protein
MAHHSLSCAALITRLTRVSNVSYTEPLLCPQNVTAGCAFKGYARKIDAVQWIN